MVGSLDKKSPKCVPKVPTREDVARTVVEAKKHKKKSQNKMGESTSSAKDLKSHERIAAGVAFDEAQVELEQEKTARKRLKAAAQRTGHPLIKRFYDVGSTPHNPDVTIGKARHCSACCARCAICSCPRTAGSLIRRSGRACGASPRCRC